MIPRIARSVLALVLPFVIAVMLVSRWRAQAAPPAYWTVPAFSLLDQDSIPFRSDQLGGTVWLLNFVYTNCPDVCPLVTQRMATLRDSLQRERRLGDVKLLSISVDPLRDSPAVLRAYAERHRAHKPDWVFLTGPVDTVIPLVTEGFRLTALHPARHSEYEAAHQHDSISRDYVVTHTDRIVLIDREGQVRGTYESSDPDALVRLWKDLRAIQ
jgi:protein SCO1/2